MIDNFILVHYLSKKWEIPTWYTAQSKADFTKYIANYKQLYCRLLKIMFQQLHHFYKDAHIHLLTNEEELPECRNQLTVYYERDLPNSHVAKLRIYGLLDKPAMFVDTDIILTRPFDAAHLQCGSPFNLYRRYPPYEKIKTIKGLEHITKVYNSGVVWIPRPSARISTELFEIYRQYFSDHDSLDRLQIQFENDEHALAVYIHNHGLEIKMAEDVNKQRRDIKWLDISKYQSIHYSGTQKMAMPTEYGRLIYML